MATLASRQNTSKNWRKLFKIFDKADRNAKLKQRMKKKMLCGVKILG